VSVQRGKFAVAGVEDGGQGQDFGQKVECMFKLRFQCRAIPILGQCRSRAWDRRGVGPGPAPMVSGAQGSALLARDGSYRKRVLIQ